MALISSPFRTFVAVNFVTSASSKFLAIFLPQRRTLVPLDELSSGRGLQSLSLFIQLQLKRQVLPGGRRSRREVSCAASRIPLIMGKHRRLHQRRTFKNWEPAKRHRNEPEPHRNVKPACHGRNKRDRQDQA